MSKIIAVALLIVCGSLCLAIGWKVGSPWVIPWFVSGLVHAVLAGYFLAGIPRSN
jgi:hypothetical protein